MAWSGPGASVDHQGDLVMLAPDLVKSWQWAEQKHIYFLETSAMVAAAMSALQTWPGRPLLLVTDNQALAHTIRTGRARRYRGAVELQRLMRAARAVGSTIDVMWTPTDRLPADALTRDLSEQPDLRLALHSFSKRAGWTPQTPVNLRA